MACRESCPTGAIDTFENDEGFHEPRIVEAKCISCGKCSLVCPVLNPPSKHDFTPVGYSGWAKDDDVRLSSSSGGIFSILARHVLRNGGVVFGVAFDDDFVARHTRVDKIEDLPKLQGSKYVQADVGHVYRQVKDVLDDGRLVLFSGTPCQVAALINYLGGRRENLILVDFVCHGVPSPRIFEDYKIWLKKHYGFSRFDTIQFRDKYYAWDLTSQRVRGTNERGGKIEYIKAALFDVYRIIFDVEDYSERKSCYQCSFTEKMRKADITIADWWGGYKTEGRPEERSFAKKGVSLVLINSLRGAELFAAVKRELFVLPRTLQEIYKTNKCFHESYPMPSRRKAFWDCYRVNGFEITVERFAVPRKWPFYIRLRVSMKVNVVTILLWKIFETEYRIRHKVVRMLRLR